MSDIVIRSARQADSDIIKAMVNRERLNPFGLDWTHFLIAEIDNQIAGIGQIKPLKDCEELASLVTNPQFRGKGVASRMIAELESRAGRPLYLKCAGEMEAFYNQFGYQTISWSEAPGAFKLVATIILIGKPFGVSGCVMRKE